MTKPYAQPVYRAAGGAICDTEEEARDKSRKYYLHSRFYELINEMAWHPNPAARLEDPPRGWQHQWIGTGEELGLCLEWFLKDDIHWQIAVAAHKEACEYADARLKEGE